MNDENDNTTNEKPSTPQTPPKPAKCMWGRNPFWAQSPRKDAPR